MCVLLWGMRFVGAVRCCAVAGRPGVKSRSTESNTGWPIGEGGMLWTYKKTPSWHLTSPITHLLTHYGSSTNTSYCSCHFIPHNNIHIPEAEVRWAGTKYQGLGGWMGACQATKSPSTPFGSIGAAHIHVLSSEAAQRRTGWLTSELAGRQVSPFICSTRSRIPAPFIPLGYA